MQSSMALAWSQVTYLLSILQNMLQSVAKDKTLYTNDIPSLYKAVSGIVHLQRSHQDMWSYLGHVETLKDEFNSPMPFTDSFSTQEQQRDKFFMVLALIGIHSDFSSVRDQILTTTIDPTLDYVSVRLLRISLTTNNAIEANPWGKCVAVQSNK